MSFVLPHVLQSPAWVAGATQQIETHRLPSVADGMPLHVAALDCKIILTVTDDDDTAQAGNTLIDCLDLLTIRDVLGNQILRLRGRHLRTLIKCVTGWRHADPAALPGTGSGSLSRTIQFRIPFHGGPGGVLGTRKFKDAWLPVDRIRGIPIELQWAAAAMSSGATITDAVLYVSPKLVPYKQPIIGSDFRYSFLDQSNAANAPIEFPSKAAAFHSACLMRSDLDHSGGVWTDFTLDQFGMMSQAILFQVVEGWNESSALDVAQHEAELAPEFIPLIFQDRRGDITGLVSFQTGKVVVQSTHTEADSIELMQCECYDTRDLATKLMGRPQTVFQGSTLAVADYAAKNQPGRGGLGVNRRVASKLNHLLAHQLKRK